MTFREQIKQKIETAGIYNWSQQTLLDDIMHVVEEAKEYAYKEGKASAYEDTRLQAQEEVERLLRKLNHWCDVPPSFIQLKKGEIIKDGDLYMAVNRKWEAAGPMIGHEVSSGALWIRKRT